MYHYYSLVLPEKPVSPLGTARPVTYKDKYLANYKGNDYLAN